jgi:PAS domain S-box-containing protein
MAARLQIATGMPLLADVEPAEILSQISDALVLLDLDGRIVFCNSAFARMVGRPDQDLRGRTWPELTDAATCAQVDHHGFGVTGRAEAQVDIRMPGERGASRTYHLMATPFCDQAGRTIGVLEHFRCLTASEMDPVGFSQQIELRRALEIHRWNASRTARALGVSRTTLWRRMRRFSLIPRA